MKRDWLNMRYGVPFAALGLLAVCVGVGLVVFQDVWFVATGALPTIWLYDKVLSYLAAAVACVFSAASVFVFRPGLPKYVAAILAISFALYVVQPLLPIHNYKELAILSIVRTVGLCSILLLLRGYSGDLKAGRVE